MKRFFYWELIDENEKTVWMKTGVKGLKLLLKNCSRIDNKDFSCKFCSRKFPLNVRTNLLFNKEKNKIYLDKSSAFCKIFSKKHEGIYFCDNICYKEWLELKKDGIVE